MTSRSAHWTLTAPGSVPVGQARDSPLQLLVGLSAAHVALALLMMRFRPVATLFALGVLALGLVFACRRATGHRAIYVAGYLATADVLWRMTEARIFWEYGKYSVILLLVVVALVRGSRRGFLELAILFFALLLPSAMLTLSFFGVSDELRQAISFNLSGPLALAVAVAFFSGLRRVAEIDLTRLLTWMVMPVIGVFTISLYSTLTASQIYFGNQANFVTSGGYGPNQVSAILGLGVLFALILALNARQPWMRWAALSIAGGLQLQSLLTFSRGGTFNLIISIGFLGLHYLQHQRARRLFLLAMAVVAVIGLFFVLPRLEAWTAGSFSDRFTSLDTTGRKDLAEADVRLFYEHPALGVGPGVARFKRTDVFALGVAPHTEFTRLVAEHGILGVAAMVTLLIIALQAYQRAPTLLSKGWVAAMTSWSLAEMSHSAMRVVAISFVFGLACMPFHCWYRED